jgi:hypothetical protein
VLYVRPVLYPRRVVRTLVSVPKTPDPKPDAPADAPPQQPQLEVSGQVSYPHPESAYPTMADSNNGPSIVATPYPTYISPGGDDDGDDAFKAALISHSGASVERNQDAQFAAAGQQRLLKGQADLEREVVQAKFDNERGDRANERERARQFAELKSELAALRAEQNAKEVASLRAELAESKASARSAATDAMLVAIAKKLGM